MKKMITPETAMETFMKCKRENAEVPAEVLESLRNYKKWDENSLKGLLNASAYFPDILIEEGMEAKINQILADFKKRIVPRVIF